MSETQTRFFRNDNPHDIYVRDGASGMPRVPKTAVVSAEGSYASALAGTNNVSEVSEDVYKAYVAGRVPAETAPAAIGQLGNSLAEALANTATLAASAPLQVVVGDDQAPYGPGTGEVTTKQAYVAENPEEYSRFTPNEPVAKVGSDAQEVSPHGVPTHAATHDRQVENRDDVEELAQALASGDSGTIGEADVKAATGEGEAPTERDLAVKQLVDSNDRETLNKLAADAGVSQPEKLGSKPEVAGAIYDAETAKQADDSPDAGSGGE